MNRTTFDEDSLFSKCDRIVGYWYVKKKKNFNPLPHSTYKKYLKEADHSVKYRLNFCGLNYKIFLDTAQKAKSINDQIDKVHQKFKHLLFEIHC